MRSWLVIGGSGFIGGRLATAAARQGNRVAYTYAYKKLALDVPVYPLDWTHDDAPIDSVIAETQPDVVVYCAVLAPRSEEALHRRVSVEGVERTLSALGRHRPDALFVYLSTNSVFGGGERPHREDDPPNPELRHDAYRAYGMTKADGERITQGWPNSIIARTSNVDGRTADGTFSARVARLVEGLKQSRPMRLFCDRYLSPTLVDNVVEALLEVASGDVSYRGVLHLAGSQIVTDYNYARAVAQAAGFDPALIQPESMDESPEMQGSLRHIGLDVAFTQRILKTRLLDVSEQMERLFNPRSFAASRRCAPSA